MVIDIITLPMLMLFHIYAEIVGSLLYLAVVTRMDIMCNVSVLTRHLK